MGGRKVPRADLVALRATRSAEIAITTANRSIGITTSGWHGLKVRKNALFLLRPSMVVNYDRRFLRRPEVGIFAIPTIEQH
mgnify:FL=1